MSWNYRILKDATGYSIREVYYTSEQMIFAWSQDSCDPYGETLEELKADYELMRRAFYQPVLKEDGSTLIECLE
jgi:hypothetical protein